MMNPFAKYKEINAEDIVKANIRRNHIGEDVNSLLNALQPLTYIARPDSQPAAGLHRNIIQRLQPKPHTLEILKSFGYGLNDKGDYVHQSPSSQTQTVKRQNAANEFQKFYNDLKKIKEGSLNGFEEFINRTSDRPSSAYTTYDDADDYNNDDEEEEEEEPRPRTTSYRTTLTESPSLLPNAFSVRQQNEETAQTIRSLKEDIKPKHNGPIVHSFIRRKLLLMLFKQNNPGMAGNVPDDMLEEDVDRRILQLKQSDKSSKTTTGDEVYFECLIRANLDADKALEILKYKRPNLKPPPEPEKPRGPTTTTIDSSLRSIQQQWGLLNRNANENGADQILLHQGDEWKNTTHLVPAIVKLRQQCNNQSMRDIISSQMYRLLYSELTRIVGRQTPLKIEIFSEALCDVPFESFEYLTMSDIRDILRSCPDEHIYNLRDNVLRDLAMSCPICTSSYPRSRMEKMFLCDHACCLDCIKIYYRGAVKEIRDHDSLRRLTCFMEEHEILEDVKLNFFQYIGTKFNQWFTNERLVLDIYHENLFIATRDSQVKKCGNPRCASFFDNNNNNRPARAQCPYCKFQQCQQCCRKWHAEHANMTCDKYTEWLRDNDPDDPEVQLTKYLNTAGMICPNERCNAIYEYQAGGCEHFTCPGCKTEFCRVCSSLFYNPKHNTVCPRPNCITKATIHAHCYLNCYREIRDAEPEEIIRLLTTHKINVQEELQQKPQATGIECPVEGCRRAPSLACENRFCDSCYKEFLCLFVWRNQIEPWELYTDNNLRQKLIGAQVAAPATADRAALIALARQHLTQFLGKPKPIPRIRQS